MIKFQEKLIALLKTSRKATIIIPVPADLDAVIAAKILADFCQSYSLKVQLICSKDLPRFLQPLLEDYSIIKEVDSKDQDLIFLVDCPTLRNSGFDLKLRQNKSSTIILIDHHPVSDIHKIAQLIFWDTQWSSTAEGLFQILNYIFSIKSTDATLLLLAIMADTGNFQFNTSSNTLKTASKLLSLGADLSKIKQYLNQSKKSVKQLRLWGEASFNLRIIESKKLAIALINQELFDKYQASEEDAEGFANFILQQNVANAILVLIEQEKNVIRGIIRSNDKRIHAGQLAKIFGGNGFDRAAGFILSGKFVNKNGTLQIV